MVVSATGKPPVRNRFWFRGAVMRLCCIFNSANVELVTKVLDGVNGYYRVFYGALPNVEYTITVLDTQTGALRSYFSPSGIFASRDDTNAFR